jgi:membrane-bound metal-dependent hydrolase YbcI (DUF457 family)
MKYDNHFMLSLFHILIIAPLLLFVGFQRADTPPWLYHVFLVLGFIILFYHGYRLSVRLRDNSGYAWVNLIHMLFVAPLLLYIGYHKKETPRSAYEITMMLGFAAIGYHLFSLVRNIEIHAE